MFPLDRLNDILIKEPKYRLKQANKALFQDLIEDWQEAKVLPQALRDELRERLSLKIEAKVFPAKDTAKALFTLEDGLKVESVLMKHKDARNTVCVSSQVGCALCCEFCATGQMGFKRSLEYSEIVDQVLFFARLLKKEKEKVTNVVFMGMGEPFLNYDNVLRAVRILNDKDGFNLGARHFSISTVGIVEGIGKLADENLQINLAISLHAADDELRAKIMPVNKKYPIEKVLSAVQDYIKKTSRKVMFEYIMIQDVNDSDNNARQLSYLLKGLNSKDFFVNLISYNPTGIFKPSLPERVKKFRGILEEAGISVTHRYRFGQEIGAACGQLAGKNN